MAPVPMHTLIVIINVESILLGINSVLYLYCLYTLWGQKDSCCRLLLFFNTLQFGLCVSQVVLHTIFLFIIITVLPDDVGLYLSHVNPYIAGCVIMFGVNYIISGFLSISRLFVLYDNEIKVAVPAFVIWIAQICATAMLLHDSVTIPVVSTYFSPVHMLLWVLIATLNLYVAILVCLRLRIAQKITRTIQSPSPFKFIAIVLVECGALITACSLAMMILYASNYYYALVGLGAATEVAAASQLLTTARRGILIQDCGGYSPTSTAHNEAITMPRESMFRRVSSPEPVKDKTLSFAEPNSQDKRDWQTSDAM